MRGQLIRRTRDGRPLGGLALPFPLGAMDVSSDSARFWDVLGLGPTIVIERSAASLVLVGHSWPNMPSAVSFLMSDGTLAGLKFSPPFWRRTRSVLEPFRQAGWLAEPPRQISTAAWHAG